MKKIKGKKTGIGYELTLLDKWFIFWMPEIRVTIKYGYEYRVDEQIASWVKEFDITDNNIELV